MAGNTKVWRAPLAGLASVAMIATMGVAAATANAASANDVVYTVNGNNLSFSSDGVSVDANFKFDDDDHTYQIVKQGSGSQTLTYAELQDALGALEVQPGNVVTGVYDAAKGGAAYQYGVDKTTRTVYVHWANSAADTVHVDYAANGVTGVTGLYNAWWASTAGAPTEQAYKKYLLKSDSIAKWQVPADTDLTDKNALDYFYAQNGDGDKVNLGLDLTKDGLFNQAIAQGDTVRPGADLLKIGAEKYTGTFKEVKFSLTDLNGDEYAFVDESLVDPLTWQVPTGRSIAAQYGVELPTVKDGDDAEKTTNAWTSKTPAKAFTADTEVDENWSVYVDAEKLATTYTVTFYDFNGDKITSKKVNAGETVSADGVNVPVLNDETSVKDGVLEKYAFDAWYTAVKGGGDKYDFSKKVAKDLNLYANYVVSEKGILFYPGYDNKEPQVVWFKTGDSFALPEFTRDGYTVSQWNDTARDTDAQLEKLVGRYVKVSGEPGSGKVELQDVDTATFGTTLVKSYTAKWVAVDAEKLEALDQRVPKNLFIKNAKPVEQTTSTGVEYIAGKDQNVFTAESLDQFEKDYQQYLRDREAAGYNGSDPTASIAEKYAGLTNAERSKLYAQLEKAQESLQFTKTKAVYRLVDPKTGRHLITNSKREHDFWAANGWNVEGLAFKTFDESLLPDSETTKSTLSQLIAPKYKVDGVTKSSKEEGLLTSVYRLYNGKTDRQHLTYGQGNEFNALTKGDWHSEGVAFYAATYGQTPVYRMYIKDKDEHFWVTGVNEYNHYQGDANFSLEGVAFRI